MNTEVKLSEILSSLQNCYKISVKNEYEEIQEDLLSSIIKVKNILNSNLEIGEEKKSNYKTPKDYTKFNIKFKLTEEALNNLPKARIPEKVFEYLIKNNILDEYHYNFFQKSNFRDKVGFAENSGDLIFDYVQTDSVKRYHEFMVNDKTYFACNQWNKPAIDKFNNYINKKFSAYIEIQTIE
ncbi:MAG: hypothetical protein A2104_04685 [Candidatus Melainabacteria bacterium GWF2_32_7]|nr:MAG: hypothetical protein A2104_04685 [Candidatus Melainabacteria bacterium GWF2_32_7]